MVSFKQEEAFFIAFRFARITKLIGTSWKANASEHLQPGMSRVCVRHTTLSPFFQGQIHRAVSTPGQRRQGSFLFFGNATPQWMMARDVKFENRLWQSLTGVKAGASCWRQFCTASSATPVSSCVPQHHRVSFLLSKR